MSKINVKDVVTKTLGYVARTRTLLQEKQALEEEMEEFRRYLDNQLKEKNENTPSVNTEEHQDDDKITDEEVDQFINQFLTEKGLNREDVTVRVIRVK